MNRENFLATIRLLVSTGRATAALTLCLLAGCAGQAVKVADAPRPVEVTAWVTSGDRTRLLQQEKAGTFAARPVLPVEIAVDAGQHFQSMVGFGASITDASAWLLQHRLTTAQRRALLEELFGRGNNGIGFEFTRLTIGASDFSRHHYSLDDPPDGKADMALAHFSIAPNRAELLPVVKEALAVNPKLQVMASPWSAPGWMKTTGSLIQGRLKPEMYDVFSRYLLRYVDAYAAEGIPVFALTLQNEPHFEPKDYPGMRLDPPARAEIIARHLGPMIEKRGMKPQIMDWDHNWDEPDSPLAVLGDPQANRYVSAVAWHCYAGDVAVQQRVKAAYPDKDAWFTECSGGEWKPEWSHTLPWIGRNLIIGSTRGWARGVLMWNLALDEKYGPHLGGCNDCRGVVTIDSRTGAVTRNVEYYALAHGSKFVRPGAQRIASTAKVRELESVAFRNVDDGSIVLIVCNSAPDAQRFSASFEGKSIEYEIPRESLATLVWTP